MSTQESVQSAPATETQSPDPSGMPTAKEREAYWPKPSSIPVTCGRIVWLFSNGWKGPRPGKIVRPVRDHLANINVELDGETDRDVIAVISTTHSGRTLLAIPVFDSMSDEQRAEYAKHASAVPEEHTPVWAEWMPFQMGQAQKTADLEPRVKGLEDGLLSLMNQTTERMNFIQADLDGVKQTQTSGLLENANAAAATPGRRLDELERQLSEIKAHLAEHAGCTPKPACDPCRTE